MQTILVRYGAIPEVARFTHDLAEAPARDQRVVVNSHRGVELGTVLEELRPGVSAPNGPDRRQDLSEASGQPSCGGRLSKTKPGTPL